MNFSASAVLSFKPTIFSNEKEQITYLINLEQKEQEDTWALFDFITINFVLNITQFCHHLRGLKYITSFTLKKTHYEK